MQLNLPILHRLSHCRNVLIVGMGNGFDLFSALPIYVELQTLGIQAHLASMSFINVLKLEGRLNLSNTLVGLSHEQAEVPYSPESFITHWFWRERGEEVPVWCLQKTGGRPLLDNYRLLVQHLEIDGILAIDGGMDAILHGDEAHAGKFVEDALSLFAIHQLEGVPIKLLGSVGMGAEPNTEMGHVLSNISRLTRLNALLGACSLSPNMNAYQVFEDLMQAVQAHPLQDDSPAHQAIIAAANGSFGKQVLCPRGCNVSLWVSPLMLLYWFFELDVVASNHLLLPVLRDTFTFNEAVNNFRATRELIAARPSEAVPIQ